jgi:CelD/BcsL family acetyltransferase involved in cellulose biosynthesis
MDFDVLNSPQAFDGLASEWNALLSDSVTDVPFLRHEVLRAWWSSLGGGEWPAAELHIVTARDAAGRLVGLAPLMRLSVGAQPTLHFLGSFEISDYLDLLVRADDAQAFVGGLLAKLAGAPAGGWKALDLYNLRAASPIRGLVLQAARDRGWPATEAPLQPCPVIALPGDWEDYLQSLDKKQRHELRRKLRRAEAHPSPVDLRWVDDPEQLELSMDAFLKLMRLDPAKSRFLTEAMEMHFRRLAAEARHGNWLRLAFLDVGGDAAAGYLFFDYGNRLWIYNSCLHPAFSELSPGWVLTGRMIQWGIEHGRSALDFLRGGEDYKFRLGGVAETIYRVRVERPAGAAAG